MFMGAMATRVGLLLLMTIQLSCGQPNADFVVGAGRIHPWGMSVDLTNGDLWVADAVNNRLLRFTESDGFTTPVAVLGQPNFTSTAPAIPPSAASLYRPQDVFIDQFGTLWVADTYNSRLLFYLNVATKLNGAKADGVLGQTNFSTTESNTTPNRFRAPCGLHVDSNGTLWVADQFSHRVLRFVNAQYKTNDAFADSVLGQTGFYVSNAACCASCMDFPAAVVTTKRGDLLVADQNNNRVIFFSTENAVFTDGSASLVIMQKALNECSSYSPTASTGSSPNGIAVDPVGNLYVSEVNNNRVVMYPGGAFTSINGLSASFVYGQSDFTSASYGNATNQMKNPIRVFFDTMRNVLWVADLSNQRVLGFKTLISAPSPNLCLQVSFQGSSPSVVLLPKDNNNGTIRPNTFQTSFQPVSIEERGGLFDSLLIKNVSFPLSGYNVSNSVDGMGTQFFNFSISLNQTTVGFEYGLFETEQQMQSAGVEYQIPSSSLKFTLTISGWKCSSPLHSLFVYFSLNTIPAISTTAIKPDASNSNLVDLVLNSTGQMTTTVRLLKYGVVDGMNTPITFSYDDGNLVLQFPCFNHSLIYDPDFSVVVGGENEEGGSGGDGLPLLAIVLPVVLVPSGLLVVGMIILVALIIGKWKQKQHWRAQQARLQEVHL